MNKYYLKILNDIILNYI